MRVPSKRVPPSTLSLLSACSMTHTPDISTHHQRELRHILLIVYMRNCAPIQNTYLLQSRKKCILKWEGKTNDPKRRSRKTEESRTKGGLSPYLKGLKNQNAKATRLIVFEVWKKGTPKGIYRPSPECALRTGIETFCGSKIRNFLTFR